jgi:hypothetical protein
MSLHRRAHAILGMFLPGATYACSPCSDTPTPESPVTAIAVWERSEAPLEIVGFDPARPGHDPFSVVDVAIERAGSVHLGDAAVREVRRFGPGGELCERTGRPGEGPGDLAFLAGVHECDDGAEHVAV